MTRIHEFSKDSEATGATKRFLFLDGMRALCALYVMLSHIVVTQEPPIHALMLPFAPSELAVCVFIIISGYSLGLASRNSRNRNYFRFMQRRAWRILPPYFAALIVSTALAATVLSSRTGTHWDDVLPFSWSGVVASALLVQDFWIRRQPNYVFWSIAVEWHLYFVFPGLLFVLHKVSRIALLALVVIGTAVLWVIWSEHRVYMGFAPEMLVLFAFGLLAADLSSSSDPLAEAIRKRCTQRSALIALIVCGAISIVLVKLFPDYFLAAVVLGVSICMLTIALASDLPGSSSRRFLEWGPLVAIGMFSYSLYLIHAPILQLLWQYGIDPLGLGKTLAFSMTLIGGSAVMIGIAYAFHVLFERPFINHRSLKSLIRSK